MNYEKGMAKYQDDVRRMETVGLLLRDKEQNHPLARKGLTDMLIKNAFISEDTARNIITNCMKGRYTAKVSDFNPNRNVTVHLSRLALIYQHFDVQENDLIVSLTEKVNSDFVYSRKTNYFS